MPFVNRKVSHISISFFALAFLTVFGCTPDRSEPYSFIVAGHTYGNPGRKSLGLYPRLSDHIPQIARNDTIRFGVFTGDIVFKSTKEAWDSVKADIGKFNKPIYFAPGNHDLVDRVLYEAENGPTYFSFRYQDDLFIILDGSLDQWNIQGRQLDMVKDITKRNDYRHLFIFVHQLIWWNTKPEYSDIKINSFEGRSSSINFWTELIPHVSKSKKPVYFFAGDIGAFKWSPAKYYSKDGLIHLVATGMGNGVDDNILIVHVPTKDSVQLNIVDITTSDMKVSPLQLTH